MHNTTQIQERLNNLGFDCGPADGDLGKRTLQAIRAFQKFNKLLVDGKIGPETEKALFNDNALSPYIGDEEITKLREPPMAVTASGRWPRQAGCTQYYGLPGNPDCTAGVVNLPAPMRLAWDLDEKIKTFRCHKLVEKHMESIFIQTVAHYGEDGWRKLGLDIFGGCYNLRKMRGGSAFSMHSWGIAVDIDPEHNQLKWNKKKANMAEGQYEPFWKIVESAGATSLGRARDFDWMHFQFANL